MQNLKAFDCRSCRTLHVEGLHTYYQQCLPNHRDVLRAATSEEVANETRLSEQRRWYGLN